MNKQSLWFTFLFSVILVLSIFYISMGSSKFEDLLETVEDGETSEETLVVEDDTEFVALRVKSDEEELETIKELQNILLDETASIEDKNEAYDSLLAISDNKVWEEKLQKMISDDFNLDSYVKINGNNVSVIAKATNYDVVLANSIIRSINNSLKDKYVTVKFN